jgi:hypothetical protein
VVHGQFKEALEFLNGRSMPDMLDHLEKLGFANCNYLLVNLGAAAWLGPAALARLEAAIRAVGLRATGTIPALLVPMLDAVGRSGIRQFPDQLGVIRQKVPQPPGGWGALIRQDLDITRFGPFLELTAADSVFRVLDFVTDGDMNQALAVLDHPQLRALIINARAADRFDGERIKQSLDTTWKRRFPTLEAPWPKAATASSLNVASMSIPDKLAAAIGRAEKFGGKEIEGKLAELRTPQSLAFMAGTIIVFAVLEGSTAGAAGVAMLALSALLVGSEVYQVMGDINGFISKAVGAKDEADLDMAGQHFARAAVAISVDILVAVLLHKPTKVATPKIQAGARAVADYFKAGSGGPPTGGLTPALAIAGEGPPQFVQAPPERLAPASTMADLSNKTTGGSAVAPAAAEAARPALSAMGMEGPKVDALLSGTTVVYETAKGVICIAQLVDRRLRVGIFSINIKDDPTAALRGFASFRGPARNAAKALGLAEYELFGAAVMNDKVEAMLLRQGFVRTTEPVPESLGLGPATNVEVLSKRFPVTRGSAE